MRILRQATLGSGHRGLKAGASGQCCIEVKISAGTAGHAHAHVGVSGNYYHRRRHPQIFEQRGEQHYAINAIGGALPQRFARHPHSFAHLIVAAEGDGAFHIGDTPSLQRPIDRAGFNLRFALLPGFIFPVFVSRQSAIGHKFLGVAQHQFYPGIVRRDPGGDEGRKLEILPPIHVVGGAQMHRHRLLKYRSPAHVRDLDVNCGGGQFLILIKPRQEAGSKQHRAHVARGHLGDLDFLVTPAGNLHGYAIT